MDAVLKGQLATVPLQKPLLQHTVLRGWSGSFSSLPGQLKDGRRVGKSNELQAPRTAITVASLLLNAPSVSCSCPAPVLFRLRVSCQSFSTRVQVQTLTEVASSSGSEVTCEVGSTEQIVYTLPLGVQGNQTEGKLLIESFSAIPFSVAHSKAGSTFIGGPGRWRYTALSATRWEWRQGADRPSEGRAADLELSGGVLSLQLRAATAAEVKRCCQQQALQDAHDTGDYDELHAQLTKARLASVDLEHLEKAEEKLKVMRKQRMHVAAGCSKDELRRQMSWDLITRPSGTDTDRPCPVADCPCNETCNPGEVLSIISGAVESCLGSGADRILFDALVEAALASEEGSVWPAGGKLIFSAFDRNQSVNALVRTLESANQKKCAQMMLKLVQTSEATYGGFVSAVQVNFHCNGESFHDQHRDVYSAKQRAGPNCACSFKECVGTVCYSLGSSRLCRLCSMVDSFSNLKPCGDQCQGREENRWLRSGDAMFFNAKWNQNHTHGIPKTPDEAGPRISVAFLLGAS